MTNTYALFDLESTNNLLRAPFLADQRLDLLPDLVAYPGLCRVVTPQQRKIVGLRCR